MKTTIGIIGAGKIGRAVAKHLSDAGYAVLISNSRGGNSLNEIAAEIGPNVTPTTVEGASDAEYIILSVPWANLSEAVKSMRNWENKVVIDTTNNIVSLNPFSLADLSGKSTGEYVSELLPGAFVVKAFNTLSAQVLASNPVSAKGNRVIVMSGDDVNSKSQVAKIISSIGFHPVDLGNLSVGGKLQGVGASLSNIDLSKGNNNDSVAIEIVKKNTEQVQGNGNFELFDEIFADDFVDHTTQPGFGNDKTSVKTLYKAMRAAFPDFKPEIHWMTSDGDKVTTFKTYHGTHKGPIFGVEPTGRTVQFETVDVMRVKNGKITDHWGVANLLSLMQQLESPGLK